MTEQPQPGRPSEARPLRKLDRGEQRVLFVTFVGRVASIVAAAMIVGLAIGFDRALNRLPHANTQHDVSWVQTAVLIGIGVIVGFGAVVLGNPRLSGLRRAALRIFVVFVFMVVLVGLLMLIGQLAGIH